MFGHEQLIKQNDLFVLVSQKFHNKEGVRFPQ